MIPKSKEAQELFQLMKSHVYRYSEKPFLLASGRESNHYFNCKEITLHPDRLTLLAKVFAIDIIPTIQELSGLSLESVGGLTLGADPISYAIALEYSKSGKMVYPLVVRKETKDHGTKKKIEGFFQAVKSCLVVDDVITTGGSTLKAVDSLREAGLTVNSGICILDREEGGRELLESNGIRMYSIFQKSDFF
ncbi:orotate phosphoribosyltransferase [Leptospira sp. GIMC2001]|uniref:orotate phosphoribosyltransferase n=1 Tax=Leptospira sp. GIMC2001 TaxID=1513297 RepID=UPI0023498109|nr:orotate phosphoribosyltransferase [Leptospira sp. GIMC2001]WCL48849.1 orotate phosphoribosyltransferase [Leptospira sp. GIMC2001]